jgi:replicative DNA helicase
VSNILGQEFRESFRARQLSPISAVPTPLPAWNRCCGDDGGGVGLADGWFVVLGGNPKFGKSLFSIDIARSALVSGRRPAFMSLEMSESALATRLYAIMTGVPIWKLEKRGFTDETFFEAWRKIDPTAKGYDLFVDDTPHKTIGEVMTSMHALRDRGYDFFVVDYLQLAAMGADEAIYKAVVEVTGELRQFAKRQNVPVVALSQFNRETSKNYVDTPMPQGLHGGMAVEASADQILLIDHSRYERFASASYKGARTWMVLTNRHGDHGEIPVEWRWDTLAIREADPDEEGKWPTNGRTKRK